jgi:anti-sigma factor RsiW
VTGCAEYGPEVSAYLDDGLDAEERRRVEVHLAGCASCTALLSASRELDRTVRELPRIEPSPGFETKLRARLGRPAAPGWRRRGGLARFAVVGAAAAAVLALLLTPATPSMSDEDWELIADEASFDLMLSDDHELVYALDVLEAWDEKEEI